jgi:hypothetical protein
MVLPSTFPRIKTLLIIILNTPGMKNPIPTYRLIFYFIFVRINTMKKKTIFLSAFHIGGEASVQRVIHPLREAGGHDDKK